MKGWVMNCCKSARANPSIGEQSVNTGVGVRVGRDVAVMAGVGEGVTVGSGDAVGMGEGWLNPQPESRKM